MFDEQHALIAGYAALPDDIPRRTMDQTGVDGISRYTHRDETVKP